MQHAFRTIDSNHVWGVVPEMENYSRNSPIEVVENGEKPIAKRTRVSEVVFRCGESVGGERLFEDLKLTITSVKIFTARSQIVGAFELARVAER
jgi:hypothetical protein